MPRRSVLERTADSEGPGRVALGHSFHQFEIGILPTSDPERSVAVAFVVLWARYFGRSTVPLRSVCFDATGRRVHSALSEILVGEETGLSIADRIAAVLSDSRNGKHASLVPPLASTAGPTAVIAWVAQTPDQWASDSEWRLSDPGDIVLVVPPPGATQVVGILADRPTLGPEAVVRFARQLEVLIAGLILQPQAPAAHLPIVPVEEEAQLRLLGSGARAGPPIEPVHRSVERLAAAHPDRPAVRYRDEVVGYGALNSRANRLARLLGRRGVGRGDRVAVCLAPEANISVALLAILKAGAVYVPVDPDYPPARIGVILEDTKPRLVLSRQAIIERLGLEAQSVSFAFDRDGGSLDQISDQNLDTDIDLEQIATIFHTSGTTGRPNGVLASHSNLAHYVDGARRRYGFVGDDVVPALARFTFSISIFELLAPLTAGATVMILDRDHVLDPLRLAATLREVTLFHAGPSLLRSVIAGIRASGWLPAAFARIRHASIGGDMVPPQLLSDMRDLFDRAEIFVIYGCSEISCMGCTDEVARQGPITRTFVGKPFENTHVLVLDAQHTLVPFGVVGEVYFAGPGVVSGYLDRSDLDAGRFLEIGGHRYYRTGDLGRLVEGRGLELVGRSDFQIKIRGMRVESAEIEFYLRQIPGIRDGVVVARDLRGEKVLVAFVVVNESVEETRHWDHPTLGATIRRHLSTQLPDYMIPAVIIRLLALPLNHNFKVDRNALPDLTGHELPGVRSIRMPDSPTEHAIAEIWCDVLDREVVGRDQNFFELGGHSLLALQAIRRIEATLGVPVDGITLLRESLEVVAALCDAHLGRTVSAGGPAYQLPDEGRVETSYFGPAQDLYGALYLPTGPTSGRAVVICAPIGSDGTRTSFVLARLARQLAARGTACLRFDYFGQHDSLGADFEGDPARWKADIAAARHEIAARTGASELTAIGVRLGGTLLLETAEVGDWARIVLWDPVLDGTEYYAEIERAHRRFLKTTRVVRPRRVVRVGAGRRELLGMTYSDPALLEIRRLRLGSGDRRVDAVNWLASSEPIRQLAAFESVATPGSHHRFEVARLGVAWLEASCLGDLLPDVGIVDTLVAMTEARG